MNAYFISLIPKKKNPDNLSDYRPISLVGSIYKLVVKVLANRLSLVVGKIVGKLNLPSPRVVKFWIMCWYLMKKDFNGGLVLEIDFQKAFDCIDRDFLNFIMVNMRFGPRWCKWIFFSCISTMQVFVLINGTPTRQYFMRRGLHQGCHLSLFLFNIVGESLSSMINQAVFPSWC